MPFLFIHKLRNVGGRRLRPTQPMLKNGPAEQAACAFRGIHFDTFFHYGDVHGFAILSVKTFRPSK